MKIISAITASAILAGGTAFAQLSTLPPPSSEEGVFVQPIGPNAGASHWEDPAGLGAYRLASDDTVMLPSTGLTWANTAPTSVWNNLSAINAQGGSVRGIFLGETAGWYNDFGFTFSGSPASPGADAFTVFENIQAVGPTPTVSFGQYFDVRLSRGEAATFDLWLNGSGSFAPPDAGTSPFGGVYTVFHPTTANVRFAQEPLMVSTWINATIGYRDVATYLVSIEDWNLTAGSDRDFSDFVFALQFYDQNGNPQGPDVPPVPVPEPSTYGLIGAITLLGLVAWKRRKVSK